MKATLMGWSFGLEAAQTTGRVLTNLSHQGGHRAVFEISSRNGRVDDVN
jgi:hypothetical protein